MKFNEKEIHPTYEKTTITRACGTVYEITKGYESEICSNILSLQVQKFVDTGTWRGLNVNTVGIKGRYVYNQGLKIYLFFGTPSRKAGVNHGRRKLLIGGQAVITSVMRNNQGRYCHQTGRG